MSKKKWFIGGIAAAVAVFTALGIGSVRAADANDTNNSISPQEDFCYEQLGRDDYTYAKGYGKNIFLATNSEDKNYTLIDKNGDVHYLDNTIAKYGSIRITSATHFYNSYIPVIKDGKEGLVNTDGELALDGNYHSDISTTEKYGTSEQYIYTVDGDKVVLYSGEGNKITELTYGDGVGDVCNVLDYLVINNKNVFDMSGNDLTSKVKKDNLRIYSIWGVGNLYLTVKYINDSDYTYQYAYFDKELKEVSEETVNSYKESLKEGSSENEAFSGTGFIFEWIDPGDDGYETTEDGYYIFEVGSLKGYTVYLGEKVVGEEEDCTLVYAIFDESKELLIENVCYYYCIGNKIITCKEDSEGNMTYRIVEVSLKSELGIADIKTNSDGSVTAKVSAKDIDKNDIKDSDGNAVNYDDLDNDAKAVIEKNFEFLIKAGSGVVPDNCYMVIYKMVSGSEYDAAKQVTQSVASRIAVFNIDLLDNNDVKKQPNGMMEITTDIPDGYNTAKIAVYRLSDDGTSYVKLNSRVVGNKVIFETNHFSTYMIVEEVQGAITPGENPTTDENPTTGEKPTTGSTETVPNTGDVNYLYVLIAVMMLAAIAGVVAFERNRA